MEGSAAAVEGTAVCETPELSSESSPLGVCTRAGVGPRVRAPQEALGHCGRASAGGPAALSCVLILEASAWSLWPKEALWKRAYANVSLSEAPGPWAGAFGPVTGRWEAWVKPLSSTGPGAARAVHQTGDTSHRLIPGRSPQPSTPRGPAVLPAWSASGGWGPSFLLHAFGVLDSV